MIPAPRVLALLVFLTCLTPLHPAPPPSPAAANSYAAKIRSAHVVWEKDSNRISDLLDKLKGHVTTANRLDKEIADAREDIRQLEENLRRQLDEMAKGRFCSQCLGIASDFERNGQSFYEHLAKVNGREIAATPEQLQKARNECAEKVAKIRERITKFEGEKKTETSSLNDVLHQLNVTIAEYHRHITDEKTLQIAAWGDESVALKDKLTDLQSQQESLAKQPVSPARDVQARALDAQMSSSLASTSAADVRAAQTATAFNQGVRRDMDALAKKANTIPDGQPLANGWFLAQQITGQNIAYVAFPVQRPQASSAAQLLKGPAKQAPNVAAPAAQKSVSDLLKGK